MATVHGVFGDFGEHEAQEVAEKLNGAMRGLGTSEEVLVECLVTLNNSQRIQVAEAYKQAYGNTLIEDLESENSGDFCHFITSLVKPPRQFDADECHRAIDGAGTLERVLIEILTTRSNEELDEIKAIYKTTYERELEEDIIGDTEGDFKRFLRCMVNARRQEEDVDEELARKDADALKEAGIGTLGTDEAKFNEIMCTKSPRQLRETIEMYNAYCTENSFEADVESELGGDIQEAFLALAYTCKHEGIPEYFARMLKRAMDGIGTYETDLNRIIISRSEIDLRDIMDKFTELNDGVDLQTRVADEVGGDLKSGLLSLITGEYQQC